MIVVADASPLNYLVLIEQIGLLPTLYGGEACLPAGGTKDVRRRPGRSYCWHRLRDGS